MRLPHAIVWTAALGFLPPGPRAAEEADGCLLDGPRSAVFPAAARDWLLDPAASAPPAVWPLPRQVWLESTHGPRLRWLEHARPLAGERPWSGWRKDGLALAAGPRLESSAWSFSGEHPGSLSEGANGLDLELARDGALGAWLHMRDAGVSGDSLPRTLPLWRERESWLWSQVQDDGSLTHDEARAGLGLVLPLGGARAHVSLVREHLRWGPGLLRTTEIQGDRAPSLPMFLLQAEAGPFYFSQAVGELFSGEADTVLARRDATGLVKVPWREKWLAAHRLDIRGAWGGLGLGEILVLGDRGPGPGALIPTGLLWSEQHAAGDRDNVLIFLDGRLRLPRALPGAWQVYGELCVDDYSISDWGQDLEGQKIASLAGLSGCPLPAAGGPSGSAAMQLGSLRLPGLSWLTVEHTRVRPYFGTHFFAADRYDHGGRALGATPEPNTRATDWEWRHEAPGPRLRLGRLALDGQWTARLGGGHLVHGANPPGGNVGGDRLLPWREGIDDPRAPFLAGRRETTREWRTGLEARWRVDWRGRGLGSLALEMGWTRQHLETAGAPATVETLREGRLRWVSPF